MTSTEMFDNSIDSVLLKWHVPVLHVYPKFSMETMCNVLLAATHLVTGDSSVKTHAWT